MNAKEHSFSFGQVLQLKIKRCLDLLLCLFLAIPLLPFGVVCILLVRRDGGPAFYKSKRVGKDKKEFDALKFRTMIVDADKYLDDQGRPTRERVTSIGKFLRRFSVDELPQILNVVKGEMSFIGPRPILPEMVSDVDAGFEPRFLVPPGISGLAQVSGRNTLPWVDRYRLDVEYVTKYSLGMDLQILFKTFLVVFTGADVVLDRNPDDVRK